MPPRRGSRDAFSRLVYSTGGEKPAPAPAREKVPTASGKGIRLRVESRSGRTVTVVAGLPPGKDLEALAKALKSGCNAGGAVKDGAIELQGDQREKARAVLAVQGLKVP